MAPLNTLETHLNTVESVEFARGNFRELPFSSDIREGINSRSAVVREVTDQWPVWVSARCQRCESRRAWSNTGARRLPVEPGGS